MISPVKVWRRQRDIRRILGKKGKVITWTKILVPGPDFKNVAPYTVILVELETGERIFGQLTDYREKDVRIGLRVISIIRKVRKPSDEGVIAYGIKFKPQAR